MIFCTQICAYRWSQNSNEDQEQLFVMALFQKRDDQHCSTLQPAAYVADTKISVSSHRKRRFGDRHTAINKVFCDFAQKYDFFNKVSFNN